MPTFGFSAFLKLLCLNDRPQQRELRVRLSPLTAGGYDFHRSLRLLCRRLLVDQDDIAELMVLADGLANPAEARSARAGLEALSAWREGHPGRIVTIPPRVFESPNHLFKVQFTPDFGLETGGQVTAIHVWNTLRPPLIPRMVYSALSFIPELYENESSNPPSDFGVLSLPDMKLYCLSDVGDYSVISRRVVAMIEEYIEAISGDLGDPLLPDAEMPF